jgi:hypothetical protein
MEWWILVGIILAGLGITGIVRLRRSKRSHMASEEKNIYPLW